MITGNRLYKDRLFRFVFNDKKKLLSLYNALNHSHYENEEELEINTLEDFIYMGMKNDISFLLDSEMCLYEHQSTFNPNMPLRGLFYFSNLLQKYLAENKYDIYKSALVPLPTPKFVVFYNGNSDIPEQCILKLSDAFIARQKGKGCLEVETLMLDINAGRNKQLMEGCRYLKDYSAFVGKVKEYKESNADLSTAIDNAIEYCIEQNIMKDVLEKHRSEVARLIFTEFDEVEFRQQQQKELDDLREQIRLAKEEAKQSKEHVKQSEKQIRLAKEEAEQSKEEAKQSKEEAKQSRKEAERLRKILEAHGWSE